MAYPGMGKDAELDQEKLNKIAAYKKKNDELKERLLDPRKRQIGIDLIALRKQIYDKNQKEMLDFDLEIEEVMQNKIDLCKELLMKKQLAQKKRQEAIALNDYRRTQQGKELSRDFDLNDPDHLRKSIPMRVGDNDPRLESKGALLTFEGEDNPVNRKIIQEKRALHMMSLRKQIEANTKQKMCMHLNDKEWEIEHETKVAIQEQCDRIEQQAKTLELIHLSNYNEILANDQRMRKLEIEKKNTSETLSHIHSCLTSEFYLEAPIPSQLRKDISLPIHFKGPSAKEKKDLKFALLKQIEEKTKRKEKEMALDQEFEELRAKLKQNIRTEKEEIDTQRSEAVKLAAINEILAKDQKERRDQMNRDARFTATEEYFAQFNKTML